MLLPGTECNTRNIFAVSYIWQITAKYEKQGKYLPILHEETCDNYFIVKWILVQTKYGKSFLIYLFILNLLSTM